MDLETPISKCGFSHRTERLLRLGGIKVIGDLLTQTEVRLLSVRGFGKGCLAEVKERLRQNGLCLAVEVRRPALPSGMVVATTAVPSGAVATGTENTGTEQPIQMEPMGCKDIPPGGAIYVKNLTEVIGPHRPTEEECGTCGHSRTNGDPGKLECHRGSPQVFFRQLGSGEIQHTGYWPIVTKQDKCEEWKEKVT